MLKRPLEPHCNHYAQTDVCSKPHLFSEIATTIRASCFQLCSCTVSAYFIYSIEFIVHWIFVVVLCNSVLLYSVCYSFCSAHKSGLVVPERSVFHLFFYVHVPDKIWVQEVGTRTSRSFARSATPSPKKTHGG
jgi:hypothetical protein